MFTYEGKEYRLVVSAESMGGTVIKIVEKATGEPLKETDFLASVADAQVGRRGCAPWRCG